MKVSIAIKWVVIMIILTVVPLGVLGYIAVNDMQDLGNSVADDAQAMGTVAVDNATTALNDLGADLIKCRAIDIGKQLEIYLRDHPGEDMKNDPYFASIAVQMLEGRGYCCLGQSDNALLLFAPNPKLVGTSMWALKNTIPGMYDLLWTHVSTGVKATAGTYDWQDPDGSIKMKYGYFLDLEEEMIYDGKPTGELVFVATAYLDDFSKPAEAVEESINSSMEATTANIDSKTDSVTTRNVIIVVAIAVLAAIVALFVARSVTKPVRQLTAVADKISKGELDVTIDVKSKDEIGDLANSFERMVAAVRFLSQDQEKGDK